MFPGQTCVKTLGMLFCTKQVVDSEAEHILIRVSLYLFWLTSGWNPQSENRDHKKKLHFSMNTKRRDEKKKTSVQWMKKGEEWRLGGDLRTPECFRMVSNGFETCALKFLGDNAQAPRGFYDDGPYFLCALWLFSICICMYYERGASSWAFGLNIRELERRWKT